MVITILCEPRSGSTNLLNWFGSHDNYTHVFEPLTNPGYSKIKSDKNLIFNNIKDIKSWQYNTENIVVKEIAHSNIDYKHFLKNSDKVIVLFRENYEEQTKSFLMSSTTQNFFNPYSYDETMIKDKTSIYLEVTKNEIKKYFDSNYFLISYEDLYYNGKIKQLIDYIGTNDLNYKSFPFGTKYRKEKTLI
jgi:NhaP-type Na+/H+ and K+/H+ antiporter